MLMYERQDMAPIREAMTARMGRREQEHTTSRKTIKHERCTYCSFSHCLRPATHQVVTTQPHVELSNTTLNLLNNGLHYGFLDTVHAPHFSLRRVGCVLVLEPKVDGRLKQFLYIFLRTL